MLHQNEIINEAIKQAQKDFSKKEDRIKLINALYEIINRR